jgi:high affinity sulfate transporter 1
VVTSAESGVAKYVPILGWAKRYQVKQSRGDVFGALTAWAIVVPESVAYAEIAGVPPQNAFYAAPVALLAYAVFGSSRNLIVGATSAASILSASTVAAISSDPATIVQLSAALAIVVGGVLLLAGLFRMGWVTNFLAESALQGFLFGMAMIIVIRQAGKLVGVSTGDGNFFERLWHLLSQIADWSLATLVVGLIAIAALVLLERFMPKLPAPLIVLVLGIAASYAFRMEHHGIEVVGHIPSAVPKLHIPDISGHQWGELAGGSFGLALVAFAESFSISSRFAHQSGHEVEGDQEMIAMGASNVAAGMFSGFAVSGSASRTAAVQGAGGRTQAVSIVAAVLVLITAAFLTPVFTQLPEAVLGAIVIVAVRGFLDVAPLKRYWHRDRSSFLVAMSALLGVLVFDLLPGLLIAVVVSLLLFIARASEPKLAVLGRVSPGLWEDAAATPDTAQEPGTLVLRPNGPLFFGNVERIRREIVDVVSTQNPVPQRLLLVLWSSYRLGVPVLDSLSQLREQLERMHCELWLVGVPSTARTQLDEDELATALGPSRIISVVEDAFPVRAR